MKKTLTLFLLLFAAAITKAQTWETVGQPGFSDGNTEKPIVVLDASGTPYMAYSNTGNGSATVKKFNGTSWENVGQPNFSAGYAGSISLAFNASGTPYVAYRDGGNSYKATVMKFNGVSWENVGLPGFSTAETFNPSIAIDASGIPYVGYGNVLNSFPGMDDIRATVMKFNGTAWENVGLPDFSAGKIRTISFAISATGTPYVAYRDEENGSKATAMKFNGDTWENVGTPGFSAGLISNSSLALDASGTPYVGYLDWSIGGYPTIMKFNGDAWENVGAPGFTQSFAQQVTLAFSGSGTLYAAYKDQPNNLSATLAKFNGDSWEYVGEPGFTHNNTFDISLAIDHAGYAYVGYTDTRYGDRTTVSKICAECVVATTSQLAPDYCGITTSQLKDNLLATPVAGAVKYRFMVSDGATTNTVVRTDNVFRINMLPSYAYNTTYTIAVSVFADGVWGAFGPACTVTTPALPVTGLIAENCGITVPALSTNLYADAVVLATGYRFRVTNGWNVQTIDKNARYFRLNEMASYHYGTAYTIEVAVKVDGTYGAYGPACTVTTPLPVTQLNDASCGINAAFNTNLYATSVPLATGYRFRVTNGAVVNVIDRPNRNFRISMLPSYTYNTTYTVEVAVLVDGVWGNYGPACSVTTSPTPGMRQNIANVEDDVVELTAFPNPFETSFNLSLETESNEPVAIQAYDLTGKMLDNRTVSPEELADMKIGENYAAGIYSLIVTQGSYTKAVKMVKK